MPTDTRTTESYDEMREHLAAQGIDVNAQIRQREARERMAYEQIRSGLAEMGITVRNPDSRYYTPVVPEAEEQAEQDGRQSLGMGVANMTLQEWASGFGRIARGAATAVEMESFERAMGSLPEDNPIRQHYVALEELAKRRALLQRKVDESGERANPSRLSLGEQDGRMVEQRNEQYRQTIDADIGELQRISREMVRLNESFDWAGLREGNIAGRVAGMADTYMEGARDVYEVSDENQQRFVVQAFGALGQAGSSLAVGALTGGSGLAVAAGSQLYDEAYQDAIANGASPASAHSAGLRVAVTAGPLEFAADRLLLGRFSDVAARPTVRQFMTRVAAQSGSEGTTEAMQQAILNGNAMLMGYDPDRKLTDEMVKSFFLGAFAGGGITAIGQATQAARIWEQELREDGSQGDRQADSQPSPQTPPQQASEPEAAERVTLDDISDAELGMESELEAEPQQPAVEETQPEPETERATETNERPQQPETPTPPAATQPLNPLAEAENAPKPIRGIVRQIKEAGGFPMSGKAEVALTDFFARLRKGNEKAFDGLTVAFDMDGVPEAGRKRAAAFSAKQGKLWLNPAAKVNQTTDGVVNSIIHESGHFAEAFVLGTDFTQQQWESLKPEQRTQAYEDYYGKKPEGDPVTDSDARAEWVAMQFARVVRGDTQGMDAKMRTGLEKLLETLRETLTKWIGSEKVTTEELDRRILEALGYSRRQQEAMKPKPKRKAATKKPKPKEGKAGLSPKATQAVEEMFDGLLAPEDITEVLDSPLFQQSPSSYSYTDDKARTDQEQAIADEHGIRYSRLDGGRTLATRFEERTGAKVRFYRSASPPEADSLGITGFTNRSLTPGVIYVNSRANVPLRWILAHELAHVGQHDGRQDFKDLEDSLSLLVTPEEKTEFRRILESTEEYDADSFDTELTAYIIGDLLGQHDTVDVGNMSAATEMAQRVSDYFSKLEPFQATSLDRVSDEQFAPEDAAITQKLFPEERFEQGMRLAKILLDEGVESPQRLVEVLDVIVGEKGRPYAAALYRMMSGVRDIPAVEDWQAVFAEVDGVVDDVGRQADDAAEPEAAGAGDGRKEAFQRWVREALQEKDPKPTRHYTKAIETYGIDRKEGEELIEGEVVRLARDNIDHTMPELINFKRLVRLYQKQPTLGTRTSTSRINQAYSTPAPLAYALSQIARIGRAERNQNVYEPTAGNGMLLIDVDRRKIVANELDPRRREILKDVIGEDITIMGRRAGDGNPDWLERLRKEQPIDAILNPPFGKVQNEDGTTQRWEIPMGGGRTFETTKVDYAIVFETLRALPDYGRAAIIVGSGRGLARSDEGALKSYRGKQTREFYYFLFEQFNVTSLFTVAGDLYSKQGASYPLDVIIIDGKGRAQIDPPFKAVPNIIDSWDGIWQRVLADQLPTYTNHGRLPVSTEPRSPSGNTEEDSGAGRSDGVGGDGSQLPGANVPEGLASGSDGTESGRPVIRGGGREGTSEGSGRADGGDGGLVGVDGLGVSGVDAIPSGQRGEDGRGRRGSDTRESRAVYESEGLLERIPDSPSVPVSDLHAKYRPVADGQSMEVSVTRGLEDGIRQYLLRLKERVGDLTAFVAKEIGMGRIDGQLAAEQVDAVAMAIAQISAKRSTIVADQTGIGKGRTAAAIIRWAIHNNRIPVFVTAKPGLFADMTRDLAAVEAYDMVKPLITNRTFGKGAGRKMKDAMGNDLVATTKAEYDKWMAEAINTGNLPEGFTAVFTTYDQIKSSIPKGATRPKRNVFARTEAAPYEARMQMLDAIADKAIFILDEAHSASSLTSETGVRVRSLVNKSDGAVFLSATFAKRPDSLPLYESTAIQDAGLEFKDLVEATTSGGLPMQQFITTMLAQSGSLIRRERTYEGVEMTYKERGSKDAQYEAADVYTELIREVYSFWKKLEAAGESHIDDLNELGESGALAAADTGLKMGSFNASNLYRITEAYLFSLKAPSAIEEAIDAIRNGERPVVAFDLTGEGAIHDIMTKMDSGQVTFADLLVRIVDQLLFFTKDVPGSQKKERISIDLDEFGLRESYDTLVERIHEADLSRFAVSPIDYIRDGLEEAGYSTAEVTGRTMRLSRNGKKLYRREKSETGEAGKNRSVAAFNAGQVDVILLNRAGSTGLSLHSGRDFSDQRPRRMIVAQAQPDINEFQQMLGRIFRTGQTSLPRYTFLRTTIPAEKRMAGMLMRKMASLNASVSSETESGVTESNEDTDLFNHIGASVISNLMEGDEEIRNLLSPYVKGDLTWSPDSEATDSEYASKITSKVVLLPIALQERFYNTVISEFRSEVEYLTSIGENPFSASIEDYRATINSRSTLKDATSDESVFGGEAEVLEIEAQVALDIPEYAALKEMVEEDPQELAKVDAALIEAYEDEVQKRSAKKPLSEGAVATTRARYNAVRDVYADALRYVGSNVVMETDSNVHGVVVGYSINYDNITAPSQSKLDIRVNQGKSKRIVPFTKATRDFTVSGLADAAFEDSYERTKQRDQKKSVVVGNLLAGLSAVQEFNPRPIRFTLKDGTTRDGIELSSRFTKGFKELTSLDEFIGATASRSLSSPQGIKVSLHGDSYRLQIPEKTGGKFWRDTELNRLMRGGEFTQREGVMRGLFSADHVAEVYGRLRALGATFTTTGSREGSSDVQLAPGYDFHRFTTRLIDDERVAQEVKDRVRREYKKEGFEETFTKAERLLAEMSVAEATHRVLDESSGLEAQTRMAMGQILVSRANEAAKKAEKNLDGEAAERVYQYATNLANSLASIMKRYGQAISVLKAWEYVGPDGFVVNYRNAINEKQGRILTRFKDEIEDLTGELRQAQQEAGDGAVETRAVMDRLGAHARKIVRERLKATFGQAQHSELSERYKQAAIHKLTRHIEAKFSGVKAQASLQEFTQRLTAELRKRIDEMTPAAPEREQPSDVDVIVEALENVQQYRDVWERVQKEVKEQFAGDEAALGALDEFFGHFLAQPFSANRMTRLIRATLVDLHGTMQLAVREYLHSPLQVEEALVGRIQEDLNVSEDIAKELVKGVKLGLEREMRDQQKRLLSRWVRQQQPKDLDGAAARKARKLTKHLTGKWEVVVAAASSGAITEQDIYNAVAEGLGLPTYNKQTADEIRKRAKAIQEAPEGIPKKNATQDLMFFIKQKAGVAASDLYWSYWMASILSGVTTTVLNTLGSGFNMVGESLVVATRHPQHFGAYLSSGMKYLANSRFATDEYLEVMKTGRQTTARREKLYDPMPLEIVSYGRGAPEIETTGSIFNRTVGRGAQLLLGAPVIGNVFGMMRYVGRNLTAQDSVFFHTSKEAHAGLYASRLAAQEGLKGAEKARRIQELLQDVSHLRQEAVDMAKAEGLAGRAFRMRVQDLIEQGRGEELNDAGEVFANVSVFTQEPVGLMGVLAQAVKKAHGFFGPTRFIVPFANVVANVTNMGLNWSPLGLVPNVGNFATKANQREQGWRGLKHDAGNDEWLDQLVRGLYGSLFYLWVLYLNDEDDFIQFHGGGPRDWNKRYQLQEQGWKPYSMQVGGTYIPMHYTNLVMPLAMAGTLHDAERYGDITEDDKASLMTRVAYASLMTVHATADRSFMSGASNFVDMVMSQDTAGFERIAGRTGASNVPNFARQVYRMFDPQVYNANDIQSAFLRDLPVVANYANLQEKLNVLGEPVTYDTNPFYSLENDDPVWRMVADKQAWISRPGRPSVGDRDFSDEEYYNYARESGQQVRRELERNLDRINAMTDQQAQDYVGDIVRRVRRNVREEMKNRIVPTENYRGYVIQDAIFNDTLKY